MPHRSERSATPQPGLQYDATTRPGMTEVKYVVPGERIDGRVCAIRLEFVDMYVSPETRNAILRDLVAWMQVQHNTTVADDRPDLRLVG